MPADPIVDAEAQATAIATKLGQLNNQLTMLSGQVADAQHTVELAIGVHGSGRAELAAARRQLAPAPRRAVGLRRRRLHERRSTPLGRAGRLRRRTQGRATVRDGFVHTVAGHRQTLDRRGRRHGRAKAVATKADPTGQGGSRGQAPPPPTWPPSRMPPPRPLRRRATSRTRPTPNWPR